jgi:hypothetical protein
MKKIPLLMTALIITLVILFFTGCGSTKQAAADNRFQVPMPSELLTPNYIEGNTGKYLSPFTSDLVVADWVDKSIDAGIGANLGGLIGTHLGRQILSEIPFVGASMGKEIGESVGHNMALNAIGGEGFLRESSDISFDSLQNMAIYLFKFNSEHPSYLQAVKATMVLYPQLKRTYNESIIHAQRW